MAARVIVLGGGVAGLTAAHELSDRGFEVVVYEKGNRTGGKAVSLDSDYPLSPGELPLPGEHGFRFFPHFYQHLKDTLTRIIGPDHHSVLSHLRTCPRGMIATTNGTPFTFPTTAPNSLSDLVEFFASVYSGMNTGLTRDDFFVFSRRIWELMTACESRSIREHEAVSWWTFVRAEGRSDAYKTYLADGLTRCMVAARAHDANARAGGVVLTQLIFGLMAPGTSIDNVLDGPTSDVWLDPWRRQLERAGVRFVCDTQATGFTCAGADIVEVHLSGPHGAVTASADFYISAVPVEAMSQLLNDSILTADPELNGIRTIADHPGWMNGIQFYLNEDVRLVDGHVTFIDSPWSLTAISQAQTWTVPLPSLGDGKVRGLLSVDISEWNRPGVAHPGGARGNKTARECSRQEIANDVWEQMKQALNHRTPVLNDGMRLHAFLDPAIDTSHIPTTNSARLFINKTNSWRLRPDAGGRISNLLLAADYVRTGTNLATMEAANEAARLAVNEVIRRSNSHTAFAKVCPLPAPDWIRALRTLDCWLLEKADLPWRMADYTKADVETPQFARFRASLR